MKFSLVLVNLFQILLSIYHELIQQVLYTQWNGFSPHFYRLIKLLSKDPAHCTCEAVSRLICIMIKTLNIMPN